MRAFRISLLAILLASSLEASRLKDLASIRGVRDNQLLGYGIVVGLAGTGDRSGEVTEASLAQALKGLGVDLKSQHINTKNAATVVVSANLPAFTKVGSRIDVVVSSLGSATSLEGGTLMMTPLKGADGKVYAVAQGRIISAKKNDRTSAPSVTLTAQIPDGALLEKEVEFDFASIKDLSYQLYQPDFTTAARIAERINEELSGKYATAVDGGSVHVLLPYNLEESPVSFIAKIESLDVEADRKAKVIVNRKTGTVVLGDYVKINPVAIAHNNIRIQIKEEPRSPQSLDAAAVQGGPTTLSAPVNNGTTEAAVAGQENTPTPPPENPNALSKAPRKVTLNNQGPSIADIVTSLNEVGATAEDLTFIIQSLKSAGALVAEVEFR